MADVAVKVPVSKLRYFRTDEYAGMWIPTYMHPSDPTLCTFEKFTPVLVKHEGYTKYVGYLATENDKVVKALADLPYVQEIDKAEYDKR